MRSTVEIPAIHGGKDVNVKLKGWLSIKLFNLLQPCVEMKKEKCLGEYRH